MRRAAILAALCCATLTCGVAQPPAPDDHDAGLINHDAGNLVDAGDSSDAGEADGGAAISCSWSGAPGVCIPVTACAAISDRTSEAHECPGPADIQCCIVTPRVADNPPVPAGYKLMAQAQVTSEMTTWAVAILHDSAGYPMFSTAMKSFGALNVLARVEWHPPDFQNSVVHRGVTLYVPD